MATAPEEALTPTPEVCTESPAAEGSQDAFAVANRQGADPSVAPDDDVMGLFAEQSGNNERMVSADTLDMLVGEIEDAHLVLDAAGAPKGESLAERLGAIAEAWISRVASSKGHGEGCQCHLCSAARKVKRAAMAVESES